MTHFILGTATPADAFDQVLVDAGSSATASVGDAVKNRNNTDPSDCA